MLASRHEPWGRSRLGFSADADYRLFQRLLVQSAERFELALHAYCLMPNHYHLLIESGAGQLSRAMQYLSGRYTQMVNYRDDRDGPLFRGRFASVPITTDSQILNVSRYIHLNPVSAVIAPNAEDWPWSSARAYLLREDSQSWLTTAHILGHFDAEPSFNTYRAFIDAGIDEETMRTYEMPGNRGQTRRV